MNRTLSDGDRQPLGPNRHHARMALPHNSNRLSEPGDGRGTNVRDILSKLNDIFDRRMKISVVMATFASILIALLDTAAIALVLPVVELATNTGDESEVVRRISSVMGDPAPERLLTILVIAVVSLFILKDLGSLAFNWWLAGFKQKERVRLQARMLRHFLTAPYTHISQRSSPDLIRTMSDAVSQVFGTAVFGLMGLVSNVASILAILAALTVAAPLPTLAVLLYFGLTSVVYFALVKPVAVRAGQTAAESSQEGWRTALAALGGIKELNLRETQEFFVARFSAASLRGAFAGRTAEFLAGLPRYLLEILFILGIGVFLLFGSEEPELSSTIGILSLFVAAGFRVIPAATGLLGNLTQFRYGATFLDLVHREVLDARVIHAGAEEPGPALPFNHVIEIDDLSFRYPASRDDVLTGVTLRIPHGESLALVGGSGAGKTTLADLVLGLHTPASGSIRVDGVDIAGKRRRWQRNVGYVAQDIYLLDASLAENIAFDKTRADIDEHLLRRVIEQAQLDEMVQELERGVDTPIGERGARLSGGQRQRVGIARALYRQPALLVLDEATAALDNETEHRITQTIGALHGQITVIVIAHRLSTIRHCDEIAFLKAGRVEAVGSFEEVAETNADFANLVRLASLETIAAHDDVF